MGHAQLYNPNVVRPLESTAPRLNILSQVYLKKLISLRYESNAVAIEYDQYKI